jgi:hypothetical protein
VKRSFSLLVAIGAAATLGCNKPEPTTAPETSESPEPTPVAGQGRIGGQGTRTAASGGDYDEEWGETKEPLNVVVDNRCSSTVHLFFGQQPRPNSNYYTTMNGRSQQSVMMMPGDLAWIIDENQNGIASTEVGVNTTRVVVDGNCKEIYAE